MHLCVIFRQIIPFFQDFKSSMHVCFVLFVGFSFFSENYAGRPYKNSPSRIVMAYTDVALAHTDATEVDLNLVSLLSCQY